MDNRVEPLPEQFLDMDEVHKILGTLVRSRLGREPNRLKHA